MPAPVDFRLTLQSQVDYLRREFPCQSADRYFLGYSNPNMRTEVYQALLALISPPQRKSLERWWTVDEAPLP